MSFSLALRAVLETKVANLESRILRDSIAYLDELWSEDDREWRHGQPGARPSPTGSYAVVMAHHVLRSIWPLDVTDAIRGRRRDGARRRVPAEVRVDVDARARITVTDLDGTPVCELTLPRGLRALFLALAARHEDGASERTVEARSIPTDELTKQLGIEPDTVRRYADRINTRLQKDARERGDPPPGELIQHMGISRRMGEAPTGRLGERRWILNVDRVSIHPDARPSRQ